MEVYDKKKNKKFKVYRQGKYFHLEDGEVLNKKALKGNRFEKINPVINSAVLDGRIPGSFKR